MKGNENIKIVGRNVILVPYEKEHVLRYHEWMKNKTLQELTASEPLSVQQEFTMQQTWRLDENKCTFVVLDKDKYEATDRYNIDAMIGDVNLFLTEAQGDERAAEVEVMIAEASAQGKGLGQQSLCLMLVYGVQELKLQKFTAKIGDDNSPSLALFRKLRFKEVSHSSVFREATLELRVTSDVRDRLTTLTEGYQIEAFIHDP